MRTYRELIAPPSIIERAECVWIANEGEADATKRVIPDGCADIIYTRGGGIGSLVFVGSMTSYADIPQGAGSCSVGVRFHPGMWDGVLRVSGRDMTNRVLPLDDLWGKRARDLLRSLDSAEGSSEFVRLLASAVPGVEAPKSPLQRAIRALELSRGRFSLDSATRQVGVSPRQFRRGCLEATGVSPKLLSRILRFRHATELVGSMSGQHAGLAYECGYSDQSHLIADFHEFAGQTPREMAASFA